MEPTGEIEFVSEIRAARRLPPPVIARAIREAAGVSQARAARQIGVHRLTFLRWETAERRPNEHHRAAYARLLDQMREAVGQ
jgi:DNA-binding transcriptional regulator YiaG